MGFSIAWTKQNTQAGQKKLWGEGGIFKKNGTLLLNPLMKPLWRSSFENVPISASASACIFSVRAFVLEQELSRMEGRMAQVTLILQGSLGGFDIVLIMILPVLGRNNFPDWLFCAGSTKSLQLKGFKVCAVVWRVHVTHSIDLTGKCGESHYSFICLCHFPKTFGGGSTYLFPPHLLYMDMYFAKHSETLILKLHGAMKRLI